MTTTAYVFDEIVTFFNGRSHHRKAVEISEILLNSSSVRLIQVDEDLIRKGFDYFRERKDKRYSLTEGISFVDMTERGEFALSVDQGAVPSTCLYHLPGGPNTHLRRPQRHLAQHPPP